jgi:hypothetical protein
VNSTADHTVILLVVIYKIALALLPRIFHLMPSVEHLLLECPIRVLILRWCALIGHSSNQCSTVGIKRYVCGNRARAGKQCRLQVSKTAKPVITLKVLFDSAECKCQLCLSELRSRNQGRNRKKEHNFDRAGSIFFLCGLRIRLQHLSYVLYLISTVYISCGSSSSKGNDVAHCGSSSAKVK